MIYIPLSDTSSLRAFLSRNLGFDGRLHLLDIGRGKVYHSPRPGEQVSELLRQYIPFKVKARLLFKSLCYCL